MKINFTRLFERDILLVLLICMMGFLPACGKKSVRTEEAANAITTTSSETITASNEDETMTTTVRHGGKEPASSFQEKTVNKTESTTASTAPNANAVVPETAVEVSTTGKKGGFPWFWILMILILAAAGGWYYWNQKKKAEDELPPMPGRPNPPLGGLSPVSGFSLNKDALLEATRGRSWTKRLRDLF